MAKDKRFVKAYSQNSFSSTTTILVDRETGVNYLYHQVGNSGGITPLLNQDGKPVITVVPKEE